MFKTKLRKKIIITWLILSFLLSLFIILFDYWLVYKNYLITTLIFGIILLSLNVFFFVFEIKTSERKSKNIELIILGSLIILPISMIFYLVHPIFLVFSTIIFTISFTIIWITKMKEVFYDT